MKADNKLGPQTLAAIKTNTDNLNLAQASATAGQKGNLIFGAVTTAAPAYTTAQSNPLSLTTTGLLRVDGSGVTQPVSIASVPSHAVTNAGTFAVQVTSAPTTAVTGTFWQATQPISGTVTANISGSISNTSFIATQATAANLNATVVGTGTFAVQATLAAETTKVIGTVNIAAAQTLATVTNLAQLGGQAITMGTGVRAAGTPRVTIATDDIVQVKSTPDSTATYAPSNATTSAYAASLIIKASAGVLYVITGYNSKSTSQFIQIHNTATLPADTAVPVIIFNVGPMSNFSFDLVNMEDIFQLE